MLLLQNICVQTFAIQVMEILGYIAAILMGISLGLIGVGGAILTVPVLVYLFHVEPLDATSYSLLIVGITASFGSLQYYRRGFVKTRIVVSFGLPAVIAGILVRKLLLPAIPEKIIDIGSVTITNAMLLMLWFSILMIAASFSMIKKAVILQNELNVIRNVNYKMITVQGFIIGAVSGSVGVGGGFLIIPALVIISKFPIREAVGTSLAIIVFNSLLVFIGSAHHDKINWVLLLSLTILAIIGTFIGFKLSHKVDGNKLKPAFGYFVLLMGIYIIAMELFFKKH